VLKTTGGNSGHAEKKSLTTGPDEETKVLPGRGRGNQRKS